MGFREWLANRKKQKEAKKQKNAPAQVSDRVRNLVDAFGGINNITGFNNCAARLRYDVRNTALVNEQKLKNLGASEIIFIGKKHVQAKFGPEAEQLNLEIKAAADTLKAESTNNIENNNVTFVDDIKDKEEPKEDASIIYAPCPGLRIPLNELSSKAFELLGSGYAIRLEKSTGKMNIYSPISGKVIVTFPTKHAFGIVSPEGLEVLVHIGVDTVKMNGLGFTSTIKQNEEVKHGQLLATIDLKKIKEANATSDIIVVVTDSVNKNKELKLLQPIEIKHENTPWFKIVD